MTHETRLVALVAGIVLGSCGPGKVVDECIPVDEQVGVEQYWCDAIDIYDPKLEWDGPPPAQARFVCLTPDEAGECPLCGLDELAASVEKDLREQLSIAGSRLRGGDQPHWEWDRQAAENMINRWCERSGMEGAACREGGSDCPVGGDH